MTAISNKKLNIKSIIKIPVELIEVVKDIFKFLELSCIFLQMGHTKKLNKNLNLHRIYSLILSLESIQKLTLSTVILRLTIQ